MNPAATQQLSVAIRINVVGSFKYYGFKILSIKKEHKTFH